MSESLIYLMGHRPLFNTCRWLSFWLTAGFGLTFGLHLANLVSYLIIR